MKKEKEGYLEIMDEKDERNGEKRKEEKKKIKSYV